MYLSSSTSRPTCTWVEVQVGINILVFMYSTGKPTCTCLQVQVGLHVLYGMCILL